MTPRANSLSRRLMALLLAVLLLASLAFLALYFTTYRLQLREERAQAAREVNLLLQAALENAMLKRDLPGLREVVRRLGAQPAIRDVVILDRRGEIRFSADGARVGQRYPVPNDTLCPGCGAGFRDARPASRFAADASGHRVLRSVNPIHNRPACSGCHGDPLTHPVNGVLVVDYDAEPIVQKARLSFAGLLFAGIVVTLATLLAVWWFMRRHVLAPIARLTEASDQLAMGNLDARSGLRGRDEIAHLGQTFDGMAERLQASLNHLLEHEHYLQSLLDAIPDPVRVIDVDYRIVHANRAYADLLGQKREQVVGRPCYESSHGRTEPCVPTLTTCPVVELRERLTPVKTMQEFIGAQGLPHRVQIYAAPLQVTWHGQRRRLVVESVRDFYSDMRVSQEMRLSAIGELAAGVGHEIRNPLGSVRLALRAALRRLEGQRPDPQDIVHYLHLVDDEIDKCIEVTERLLKLSGLTGDSRQPVDVGRAVHETLSLLAFEAGERGVTLHTDLPDTPVTVLASEGDLRMVVVNLTQNAFHAMPDGGELTVRLRRTEGEVVLTFEDTGVGIPPELLPRIFDPFFSHRADGERGMGLGLTICRTLVERWGGHIEATNHSPRGARFTIRLPAGEAPGRPPKGGSSP